MRFKSSMWLWETERLTKNVRVATYVTVGDGNECVKNARVATYVTVGDGNECVKNVRVATYVTVGDGNECVECKGSRICRHLRQNFDCEECY